MKIWIPLVLVLSLSACGGNVALPGQSNGSTSGAGGASGSSTNTSASVGSVGSVGSGSTGTGGGATVCGGLKSLPCAPDEWCDYPSHDCGAFDATGVCMKRPTACGVPPPNPVCACDGKSYADACHAEQAGYDIHVNATCLTPVPFACGPGSCKAGQEYCQVLNGFAVTYQCVPLPASCLPPNATDCGCMPIAPDCGSCSAANGQLTESHGCG